MSPELEHALTVAVYVGIGIVALGALLAIPATIFIWRRWRAIGRHHAEVKREMDEARDWIRSGGEPPRRRGRDAG